MSSVILCLNEEVSPIIRSDTDKCDYCGNYYSYSSDVCRELLEQKVKFDLAEYASYLERCIRELEVKCIKYKTFSNKTEPV